MTKRIPTVWIDEADYDLRARRMIVQLANGRDVRSNDLEVLRRVAELVGEQAEPIKVRFARLDEKAREVEYDVATILAATRVLEQVVEVRPGDEYSPPDPPISLSRKRNEPCPICHEAGFDGEIAFIRHDITKHDGLQRAREIHESLYCPKLVSCGCKIEDYKRVMHIMARERLTEAGLIWDPLDPFGAKK